MMIHYIQDILLNSENRERMEAIEETKEKEAWSRIRNNKSGFRRRNDNKKPRMEHVAQEYTEVT